MRTIANMVAVLALTSTVYAAPKSNSTSVNHPNSDGSFEMPMYVKKADKNSKRSSGLGNHLMDLYS